MRKDLDKTQKVNVDKVNKSLNNKENKQKNKKSKKDKVAKIITIIVAAICTCFLIGVIAIFVLLIGKPKLNPNDFIHLPINLINIFAFFKWCFLPVKYFFT